jgi:endonuclease/exonuclease/phosphatase family metal-dependent hydrolase
MRELAVSFWNVENLFDTVDAAGRSDKLRRVLKKELAGWTDEVLARKIRQLSAVIRQLHGGRGPDLLGVCEVENQSVLERLVAALNPLGRNYGIVHADTGDGRGIDVAFLYDRTVFTAVRTFSHVILRRLATRDLFQVNFQTPGGRTLVAIGNHWPARLEGQWESEPYRMTAGDTLAYWAERIRTELGRDVAVLVMGDFNDEPFNRSVAEYALAGNSAPKVLLARDARFFNLMWPFLADGLGTYYLDNFPAVLDQFWVSKGILDGSSGLRVRANSTEIVIPPAMKASGVYPRPRRFGRPSEGYDPDGFSDHYPISLVLEETP